MPRHLSIRLGEVHTLPVAHHPLYAAIDAQLRAGNGRELRAAPWTRPMLGAAFGAALLLPGMAGAATITVNDTAWTSADDGICAFPEAVTSANTNAASGTTAGECDAGDAGLDEIQFDASLLNSTIHVDAELAVAPAEPLNIVGPGTAGQLVLDGGYGNRLLQASADVSVSNLTARNFYSSGEGGAIRSSASVTVSNGHFDNNYAVYSGGAIHAASVTVSDSQFTNNDSRYGSGGAIAAPVTNVTNSTFSGNTAYRFGGAISAYGQATVAGSTFTNNRSGYASGGAIATSNADISGSSVFTSNRAYRTGGAVFTYYGGSITASRFSYNQSASGGAVFAGSLSGSGVSGLRGFGNGQRKLGAGLPQLDISIANSQFDHNRADNPYGASMGGAIAAFPFFAYDSYSGGFSSNSVSLSGSTLRDNIAFPNPSPPPPLTTAQGQGKQGSATGYYGLGGGLMVGWAYLGAGVTVASRKGGKVASPALDVSVDIDNTSFENNLAFIGGGALVLGSTVTVDDSSFDNNGGLYLGGGGVFLSAALKYGDQAAAAADSVSFANTTFNANRSLLSAGGVMAFTGKVNGNALKLTNNQTALHSGFYDVVPAATLSAAGVGKTGKQVGPTYCSAGKYGGGGLLMSIGSTQLTGGSQITGNCAGINMGGLGVGSGKYGGIAGSLLVAADTVVSDNRSYASNPGMNAFVGSSGSGSIGGTFTGNVVQGDQPGSGGGLLLSTGYGGGSLSVHQATVSGNFAASGGGIAVQSLLNPYTTLGSVSISDSTISGNTAAQGAGVGIAPTYSGASAVVATNSPRLPRLGKRLSQLGIRQPVPGSKRGATATAKGVIPPVSVSIRNTTIDGNATSSTTTTITEQGGGLFAQYASLALDHVTITGNSTGGDGGGVMLAGVTPTVSNSIIGLNTAAGTGNDVNGTLNIDYSLVQDATGGTLNGANNLTSVDPLLDPLADNGGPTQTRLPQFLSLVVDAGDPAFNTGTLPDDQRGPGFPRDAGGRTDMGAVEGITPREVIGIGIAPNPFAEGTAASMTVTLDGIAQVDTLVTVDLSGSAVLDTDFSSGDGDAGTSGIQVRVLAGNSSGSVQLDATADSLHEGDEAFTATVSAADFATIPVTPPAFAATITDGDTLSFRIADASGAENIGNLDFMVSLNVPSTQAVSVDAMTLDGTALAAADYTAVSTTVNFAPGSIAQAVSVPITDDAVAEPAESFAINLSGPSTGSIADGNAAGTIIDNEATPTVSLSLTPPSNIEGGGSFMVTANLSGPSSQNVVVTLNFGGTAAFGSDFTVTDQDPGTPGIQIVIPAGSTSASVLVTPLNDGEDEPDETIVVSIGSATGASAGGAPGSGTITNVAAPGGAAAIHGPELIPTLNEWMLLLLGLLLPAAVMVKLRGGGKDDKLEA